MAEFFTALSVCHTVQCRDAADVATRKAAAKQDRAIFGGFPNLSALSPAALKSKIVDLLPHLPGRQSSHKKDEVAEDEVRRWMRRAPQPSSPQQKEAQATKAARVEQRERGQVLYQASSPDEMALVTAAKVVGWCVSGRRPALCWVGGLTWRGCEGSSTRASATPCACRPPRASAPSSC